MSELKPKRALGRGLSSLLDDISEEVNTPRDAPEPADGAPVETLPISQIYRNESQPRRFFDEVEMAELVESIREKGVLQPILVRPRPGRPGEYEIIAGERRWRAAQRARRHDMPVIIRAFDDGEALEIAIIENVQRSDLNAIEEALAYRQLMDTHGYTQESLKTRVGKSREHIANVLRLLNLPDEVQDLVRTGKLSAGHARTILMADDPVALARDVVSKAMSVRATERAVKSARSTPKSAARIDSDPDTRALEDELSACLQMKVSIRERGTRGGGELSIAYKSLEDLEELRGLLIKQTREMFASG